MDEPTKRENVVAWISKFSTALVAGAAFFGCVYTLVDEFRAQRIIIEPIDTTQLDKEKDFFPTNLNLRIVEQIDRIRDDTKARVLTDHKAVTRVDDVTFKAEGIEFSAIKLLAPIKAAFGRSDTSVAGELTCYRLGCEIETEEEEPRFAPKPPAKPASEAADKNTLRVRLAIVIESPAGAKTYETRLSLNKWTFSREIDQETMKIAEAIMETTDPMTAASFFYLRSGQYGSGYYAEKYRKRAVTAAKLAYERGRADACWMNNFLATIAIDEMDLNGANYRIDAVPESGRAADQRCDADLHLTRGEVKLAETRWKARREGVDLPLSELRKLAHAEFTHAVGQTKAQPETRAAAAIEAARVVELLTPDAVDPALKELERHADRSTAGSLSAERPDLAMKLLVEASRIERRAKRIDAALSRLWRAVQSFPGATDPYMEIARGLVARAQSPQAAAEDRKRDLDMAESALHEAINSSADDQAVEIRVMLADLHIGMSDAPGAIRILSNVRYELDRTHHQPASIKFEKQAYARWLFLMRRDAARGSDACDKVGFGLSQLKDDSAQLFLGDARAALCQGPLGNHWALVKKYEENCGQREGLRADGLPVGRRRRFLKRSALWRAPPACYKAVARCGAG